MFVLIIVMILLGILLMLTNIVRYYRFMQRMTDVLVAGGKKSGFMRPAGLVLLIFFLGGYVAVALFGDPDMIMASILLGGSIFVAIILTIVFELVQTVKERTVDIAEVLISVIEARDPNLRGHSIYVRNLAMLIYDHLPQERKDQINSVDLEYAALMHDVGKLGVPESILNKPGKLNEEEWQAMRRHPQIGVEILGSLEFFAPISKWILYHHERMDGKGYYGVTADKLPFAAKLLCVADAFSAITMERSYKKSRSYEEGIHILKDCAGTQFDPEIVDVFLKIPKEEVLACKPDAVTAM